MATRATAGGVGKRELPRGRVLRWISSENRVGTRTEPCHCHCKLGLEDSADGMLGPVTSETGRTRSQHSLLYVYRTDTLTVERIIMLSLVLILADAKIRHGVNDFRVRRITQDNSEPDREHRHGLAMVEREPRAG